MSGPDFPVALYLQDAHDIREGIELARRAEAAGFDAVWQADSRLVRDAVVPMAAFAAATERIKIGSGVIDIWTRNAARLASTFSTLDDLAPGPHPVRPRRLVGPAGDEGRHRPPHPAAGDARGRHRGARPAGQRDGDARRHPRPPRRRRARLRVPGAAGQGRPHLHRRHRHADDGAHRAARRRRRPQLPRRPELQRRGPGGARAWRGEGRVARSTTSTARSSSCAASTAIARRRSTVPA